MAEKDFILKYIDRELQEEMVKAIYFDLFFTLIVPAYEKTNNEYELLNL